MDTPDILDCKQARYFWISWNGPIISVGHGAYSGTDTFITFEDSSNNFLDIRAVSLQSVTFRAEWTFSDIEGRMKIIQY